MNISRKQLWALFFSSLVTWCVGNGLVPLLPVYVEKLGADAAVAGYYLGFSYLALALGAFGAGWISGRLRRQKLPLLVVCALSIPTAWLMGQAGSVLGLTAITAVLWCCGGMSLVYVGILTGLSAGKHERGKIFGLLGLTSGLGSLVGSLLFGWVVERWGYPTMFLVSAGVLSLGLLSSLFLEEKEKKPASAEKTPAQSSPGLGKSFYWLFSACVLTSMAGFLILLMRSILMDDLKFSPFEISSTGAIGGLISMPFPYLMGWFSDRAGRKTLIVAGYLTALAAVVLLAFSQELWQFWLVIGLNSIATGTNSIGNALVSDLVPAQGLHKALSIFSAAAWVGGVLGFAVAGVALQSLGVVPTFIIGGCMAIVAVALLVPIQSGASRSTANHA